MSEPEKREAILQAALELIAERGLHDTPMSLVIKRSGAGAGTIYHYFTDKEDMIRALYRYVKRLFDRALWIGTASGQSHAELFRQTWLQAYRFYLSHGTEASFLDQYENSPYYYSEPAATGAAEEHIAPQLLAMLSSDTSERLTKDLPIDVLYELSIGVAARVAKGRSSGLPALDEETLSSIADACYRAIMR